MLSRKTAMTTKQFATTSVFIAEAHILRSLSCLFTNLPVHTWALLQLALFSRMASRRHPCGCAHMFTAVRNICV